jgi:hypothetical protein
MRLSRWRLRNDFNELRTFIGLIQVYSRGPPKRLFSARNIGGWVGGVNGGERIGVGRGQEGGSGVVGRRSAAGAGGARHRGLRLDGQRPVRVPTPNVKVCAAARVSCTVSTVTAPAASAKVSATAKKNCFMMIPLSAGLHAPLQLGRRNRVKGSNRTARSSAVLRAPKFPMGINPPALVQNF